MMFLLFFSSVKSASGLDSDRIIFDIEINPPNADDMSLTVSVTGFSIDHKPDKPYQDICITKPEIVIIKEKNPDNLLSQINSQDCLIVHDKISDQVFCLNKEEVLFYSYNRLPYRFTDPITKSFDWGFSDFWKYPFDTSAFVIEIFSKIYANTVFDRDHSYIGPVSHNITNINSLSNFSWKFDSKDIKSDSVYCWITLCNDLEGCAQTLFDFSKIYILSRAVIVKGFFLTYFVLIVLFECMLLFTLSLDTLFQGITSLIVLIFGIKTIFVPVPINIISLIDFGIFLLYVVFIIIVIIRFLRLRKNRNKVNEKDDCN